MQKMFRLFFILNVLFFAGCGKDDSSPSGPVNADPNVIQDKIANWHGQYIDTLIFTCNGYNCVKSHIGADGSFTIKLPEASEIHLADTKYLSDLHLDLSAPGLLMGAGAFNLQNGLSVFPSNEELTNSTYYKKVGSCIAEYWYFDRDCDITGIIEYNSYNPIQYYYYNIKGHKGWNKIYNNVVQRNPSHCTITVTTDMTEDVKYYLFDF